MFRLLTLRILAPRQHPIARYHITPALNMVRIAPQYFKLLADFPNSFCQSAKQFTPEEWYIVEASPGGVDKEFVNRVTGSTTWGAPPGADPARLLKIPGAETYWGSLQDAERFIRESEAEAAAERRAAGAGVSA